MNNISALIPYKPDQGRRNFLWDLVKTRYQTLMPEVELCIGCDDNPLFCRAKALNEAARKATGDVFMLVDVDLVFDPVLLERVYAVVHFYPWIVPFSNAYRLTRNATDRWIEGGLSGSVRFNKEDSESDRVILGAYMNVMTRCAFESVNGLDERFVGYGFEDIALALSLETICGPHYRMEGAIYHLWHPWADFYHENYSNNLSLYYRYREASGDIVKMKKLIQER